MCAGVCAGVRGCARVCAGARECVCVVCVRCVFLSLWVSLCVGGCTNLHADGALACTRENAQMTFRHASVNRQEQTSKEAEGLVVADVGKDAEKKEGGKDKV